jgi:hypothetical protein
MRRYGKNEIKCLPVPKRKSTARSAIKFVVGATFMAAATAATVKNWQLMLEDVERIKAEKGQKTLQLQSEAPKLMTPDA